jgi:3-methyladenine DNA glycosylase AlkD
MKPNQTDSIIKKVRKDLCDNADEKTKDISQRFFKEEVAVYGIRAAVVGAISKSNFKALNDKSKQSVFAYCEEFWKSGMLEETFIACNWSYLVHKQFTTDDFKLFERWVNTYINNWASCDTFCNHTMGEFVEKYPGYINKLKGWAFSPNRWMRRATAVSLIVPARKGLFLNDIFEIADIMLTDTDDMVQKGYGWMHKVASQRHQQQVFEYVMKHKTVMPRTALRYAVEKMPEQMKKEAMQK